MIKVAIVDDERKERDVLSEYFNQIKLTISDKLEICTFSSGEELMESFDCTYDLVTLDISMKNLDGIKTAETIRKLDENVIIIFVTNMAQMAIKGYEVRALDFIVKPVSYYPFAMKINSAFSIIMNKKVKNIVIPTQSGIEKFSSDDLYYAEVMGHTLVYHTNRGDFQRKEPISNLEKQLEELPFRRCNNCYLINLKYVDSINKDMLLVGGNWLKISRPRKKEFLQSLAEYMGGGNLC
ncbi:MAG: LytR/AlgR family response regulator transcription factor [Suipraeoptans sp.]